jgi:phosphoribosyl-dephospho-CoA transferase
MLKGPAPVHALLRLTDPAALAWEAPRPHWSSASSHLTLWVGVRRAPPRPGLWPVGVRGRLRSQRSAAWLPLRAMRECVTPQMLAAERTWRRCARAAATPALDALDEVAAILSAHGFAGRWGPGGSVGFELVSGVPSTTAGSDLDLVLNADEPMTRTDAIRLHADLSRLPVRIDLLLETPRGAAVLAEYARGADAILLRSAQGPRLVGDLWGADGGAVGAR